MAVRSGSSRLPLHLLYQIIQEDKAGPDGDEKARLPLSLLAGTNTCENMPVSMACDRSATAQGHGEAALRCNMFSCHRSAAARVHWSGRGQRPAETQARTWRRRCLAGLSLSRMSPVLILLNDVRVSVLRRPSSFQGFAEPSMLYSTHSCSFDSFNILMQRASVPPSTRQILYAL